MPKISQLAQKLEAAGLTKEEPLWKGPEVDGITQSLLSRFLCCRERFRLLVVEGLAPPADFNQRLEYGNMWHVCEEAFVGSGNPIVSNPLAESPWERALRKYCVGLAQKYPTQASQVTHWYNVCKLQFPIYIKWWQKHPDMINRTPLLQEQVFSVPYKLPSGRVVTLKGKLDSVDLITKKLNPGIWLQENKTKGDVDERLLTRQLHFDLQTGIYLVALDQLLKDGPWSEEIFKIRRKYGIAGVRYNVIRRPLSGGKHSIRQHQPKKSNPQGESLEEYYNRLAGLIENESIDSDGTHYFFKRWNVDVTPEDLARFRQRCLDPILESLWDWWTWIRADPFDPWRPRKLYETMPSELLHVADAEDLEIKAPNEVHWQFPFGVYNPMLEGKASELDEYLAHGSMVGLQKHTELFPEL